MLWAKKMICGALLVAGLLVMPLDHARAGETVELLMFEEAGCPWCAVWNREIAPIYPKTPEGKRAPLRRVDLHAPRPDDLAGIKAIRYSPTFVLVQDGKEIGRIQGYPGEDFFWGLLARLIEQLDGSAGPRSALYSGQLPSAALCHDC